MKHGAVDSEEFYDLSLTEQQRKLVIRAIEIYLFHDIMYDFAEIAPDCLPGTDPCHDSSECSEDDLLRFREVLADLGCSRHHIDPDIFDHLAELG